MALEEDVLKATISGTDLVEHVTRLGAIEARSFEGFEHGCIKLGKGYLLHPRKVSKERPRWETIGSIDKYPIGDLKSPSGHDVTPYKEMFRGYRTDLENINGVCTIVDFSSGMLYLAHEAEYKDREVLIMGGRCVPIAVYKECIEQGINSPFLEFSYKPRLLATHDIGFILQNDLSALFEDPGLDGSTLPEPELLTV